MAGNLNVGSINDVGFMPINLAINPEFTINQRGAASPTAATGYNYDRWYYDGSNLLQGIENLNLRATTYVVSWEGSATCSYSLNTAASSSQGGQTYTSITNGGTLTIASVGSNNLWIKFSGTLTGLTKVSVVPSGTKSPFLPRQYQQELALCQRYCQSSGSFSGTFAAGTTGLYSDANAIGQIALNWVSSSTLRDASSASLTMVGTQGTDWAVTTSAGVNQTGFTLTLAANGKTITCAKTAHGLTGSNTFARILTSSGKALITSEL